MANTFSAPQGAMEHIMHGTISNGFFYCILVTLATGCISQTGIRVKNKDTSSVEGFSAGIGGGDDIQPLVHAAAGKVEADTRKTDAESDEIYAANERTRAGTEILYLNAAANRQTLKACDRLILRAKAEKLPRGAVVRCQQVADQQLILALSMNGGGFSPLFSSGPNGAISRFQGAQMWSASANGGYGYDGFGSDEGSSGAGQRTSERLDALERSQQRNEGVTVMIAKAVDGK